MCIRDRQYTVCISILCINIKNARENEYKSVSYTHLDVYKRQVEKLVEQHYRMYENVPDYVTLSRMLCVTYAYNITAGLCWNSRETCRTFYNVITVVIMTSIFLNTEGTAY